MLLIDGHGSDYGLRVELDGREVLITQWGELNSPDKNGSLQPHLHKARIDLEDCLEMAERDQGSQRERVISGALNYLGHWGGVEIFVDDEDRPCKHFGGYCDCCPKMVYDNGGETADRYTIVTAGRIFGSSEDPTHPMGVWSDDEYVHWPAARQLELESGEATNLGEVIPWESLPEKVRSVIKDRLA